MSAVRGYAEVAEDLTGDVHTACLQVGTPCSICRHTLEAAALLAAVAAALPPCPRCGGTGYKSATDYVRGDNDDPTCPAGCDHGKVTVAQMAALWRRVWMFPVEERTEASWAYDEGWRACIDHLRSVRSPSPKEGP